MCIDNDGGLSTRPNASNTDYKDVRDIWLMHIVEALLLYIISILIPLVLCQRRLFSGLGDSEGRSKYLRPRPLHRGW
jgi:hypothetical protein